jgi:SNF2 family DNA or RNA helicase
MAAGDSASRRQRLMVSRFSSRLASLDQSFLNKELREAQKYIRICGYFSHSILEVAGEALETVRGPIFMVCNSHVTWPDAEEYAGRYVRDLLLHEWREATANEEIRNSGERILRLAEFLRRENVKIKILPDSVFGLIHGKAGVITKSDGKKISFIGSINETLSAWRLNYELLWQDDSPEAAEWVETEFEALFNHPRAIEITDAIVEDVGRLAQRQVKSLSTWQKNPEPAAVAIESSLYTRASGLWPHQKYFVQLAFDAHRNEKGARFVLADQVGLGKTVQLAMTAQLIALVSDKPILIGVPATLMQQWQTEMIDLLDLPSAYWNGKGWVDEAEVFHPREAEQILKCPRRIGIVSQGLLFKRQGVSEIIRQGNFAAVIIDEAHRARRRSINENSWQEASPERNNLLNFIRDIAAQTETLILATATPVQLDPVEAWDLLDALSVNHDGVLGDIFSKWRSPHEALTSVLENAAATINPEILWEWMRNPLPPGHEEAADHTRPFAQLRQKLRLKDSEFVAGGADVYLTFKGPERQILDRLKGGFHQKHNPFLRRIVRRTRDFLEKERDPETGEALLARIDVKLYGESDAEVMQLAHYQRRAVELAGEFCELYAERKQAAGFMQTMLLRRICSSLAAGYATAARMLGEPDMTADEPSPESYEDTDDTEEVVIPVIKDYSTAERELLKGILLSLKENKTEDPKFVKAYQLLTEGTEGVGPWLKRGVIIFSQYYDTVLALGQYLAEREDLRGETIGIYAGSGKSQILFRGELQSADRDYLKNEVKHGRIRILLGTDAASEGLNLQALGTLINLDLPWNPTRLEQRKGRIQRIGQKYEAVHIYNMRYKDSVEDRVYKMLSERLENIRKMFGDLPDVLEDAWVKTALNKLDEARMQVDPVIKAHSFDLRYNQSAIYRGTKWETCANVLNNTDRIYKLKRGW